jgi:cyclic pyranopterin phosphate synthase
MVDVGNKPATRRTAVAEGAVRMSVDAFELVRDHAVEKGDVVAVAELAGVMAAKKTGELIPLCHPLVLDVVTVEVRLDESLPGVRIVASASLTGRTGVEMEALTAVSVACLTVYDMVKSVDRDMVIDEIRLVSKTGGTRGDWHREAP